MMKGKNKKILLAALAALASGGVIYALRKKQDGEDKSLDGEGDVLVPPIPTSTYDDQPVDTTFGGGVGGGVDDEVFGGGGGGGAGINAKLCRGLDANGAEVADLVNQDEECPASTPFGPDDDAAFDDYVYDSYHCFDVDENNEVIEIEKEFITESIPCALISSYNKSNCGKWVEEQVGVYAPGTANKIFLPIK